MTAELAFGLTAGRRADHPRLAAELERLGYVEAWSNDTRRGDGVVTLAELATGSATLRLGLGVAALSEHPPTVIRSRVASAALPPGRLTLGVGSGASASLELVRYGVEELRRLMPGTPIAVAAVGPRMLRLAGEVADVVVATWALPDRIGWIHERVAEGAAAAGRATPRIVLYLRTAVGRGAEDRLRTDMERYASYGPHYARAFAEQGDRLVGVAVESWDRDQLRAALDPYLPLVDTLVIRALPRSDDVDAWLEVAIAARP